MKANTSKAKSSKTTKTANGSKATDILLSIGLIVKNEEKYLDRCLSALKPICDAISTEIVIVDTGSTDATVEIAKRYTDKVYFFEWIDDFSAARNYGLERCSGEWFMFIDADEIFDEDVSAFVEFFKSGKYRDYNSACIHLKNYEDDKYQVYNESIPTRLAKHTNKLEFINKIHECFYLGEPECAYDIKVFADHYGYVGSSVNDAKLKRNKELLLKDFEKDPTNAVTISYLHFTAEGFEEKEKYLKMWLNLVEDCMVGSMPEYCYLTCTQFYFKENKYKKAAKYGQLYLSVNGVENELSTISVLIYTADAFYCLKEYEEAKKHLNQYFELYKKYEAGELSYRLKTMLMGIQSYEAEQQKYVLADCYAKTGDYDRAYEVLKTASLKNVLLEACDQCGLVLSDIFIEKSDVDGLIDNFKELVELDLDKATSFIAECYWKLRKEASEEAEGAAQKQEMLGEFLKGASEAEPQSFGGIMCEVLMSEGKAGYDGLVQSFIDMIPSFAQAYSPVIAAGIKTGCSMQKILSTASRGEIAAMCQKLFAGLGKDEYAEIVVPYVNAYGVETLQELFFMIELLEPIRTVGPEIYYSFAMLVANYVTNVYSEEVLNDEDVSILPPNDAFGYYVYKADVAQNAGDKIGFVKALRQALKICPDFKETVVMLTEDLGEEIEG